MALFRKPSRKVYVHPAEELSVIMEELKSKLACIGVPVEITKSLDLVKWLETTHGAVIDFLNEGEWIRIPSLEADDSLPPEFTLHMRRKPTTSADDDPEAKRQKLDWMQQLLDACNFSTEAVLEGDSTIEPLPWPFCSMEDAVMEDEGSADTKDETSEEKKDAVIEANELKLRVFNLGENITVKAIWGKESDLKIIERKSYTDLWSRLRCLFQMRGRKSILLLGNPGIGKTAFLLYVLLMLLAEKKTILMQTKGGQLYFFKYERNQYSFSKPTDCNKTDLDTNESIHYLVDGKLSRVPVYVGKCLLACTPLKKNFKEFEKDEGCKKFYLPVWSASEMSLLRKEVFGHIPKEVLEKRYSQFGGIPGFVLEFPDEQMSTVIGTLPAIDKLVDAVTNQTADKNHPSHKVMYMKVAANYENFELIYSSPYVRERLFDRLYNQGLNTLKTFLTSKGYGLQGYPQLQGGILELFFKRLAAQKASFPVFEVFQNKESGEEKKIEFVFGEPKYVKTLDDVDKATDVDRIIWPQKTNRETVDALVLRKRTAGIYILQAFQVTLSSSKGDHGLKCAGMLDLMNRFKIAAGDVEVYVVSTESRFKEAGYQSWRIKDNKVLRAQNILNKLEGIRQFALICGGA